MIDWNSIIASIIDTPGRSIKPDKSVWNTANPAYKELYSQWEAADFNTASIGWINYYPGDFDESLSTTFAESVGVTHIRSWISRINPGCCTPWHWDIDDHEQEYLKLGKLRRFSVHISKPAHGHVFIINDQCHYMQDQGTVFEWDSYKDWHAGMNCGFTPKFLYNFLGYSRE